MRITPLDVRKQEFRKAVRGLDADEVHAFLATVADEYEFVLTDNKKLRDKVIELDEKVGEYRNMERTLRDTLLTAERVMAEARQNARKEADLILRDAQMKATQEVAGINGRVEGLHQQVRELRGHRDSYLVRLHSLSEAQISLVDSYRKDFESTDARMDGVRDQVPAGQAPAPAPVPTPTPTAAAGAVQTPSIPAWDAAPVADMVPVADAAPQGERRADEWRSYAVGNQGQAQQQVQPPVPNIELEMSPEPIDQVEAPQQAPERQQAPEQEVAPPHMHTPEPGLDPAFNYGDQGWEAPTIQDYPIEEETSYADHLSDEEYGARVASVADAWSGAVPSIDADRLPEAESAVIDEVSAAIDMFSEGGEDSEDLPAPAPMEGESASIAPVSTPAELAPDGLPTESVGYAEGSPYPEAATDDATAPTGSGEHEESGGNRWSISRIARGLTGG